MVAFSCGCVLSINANPLDVYSYENKLHLLVCIILSTAIEQGSNLRLGNNIEWAFVVTVYLFEKSFG